MQSERNDTDSLGDPRWSRRILFLLILIHLGLLSAQPDARSGNLERWGLAFSGAIAQGANSTFGLFRQVSYSIRTNHALKEQNAQLLARAARHETEIARLHGIEEELRRLSRLASYSPTTGDRSFVADVVFVDPSSWLRTLVLNTGNAVGAVNQPVVTADGLVGRLIVVGGRYAKVQLITDQAASASAMIERTRRQGSVRGSGRENLELDHIPILADVQVGDRVVTAGIDGVYPRGIPVGYVVAVAAGSGLFQQIEVAPAIDFGLLDQVRVLDLDPIPSDIKDLGPRDQPSSEGSP